MLQNPLVSVLMTAYNREKYIAEAIESVLASTYQNWELIIVDDCSRDRTVEIARGYEAKDSRIKVYVNEQNLGDYPNRNKAASYAKGKYLKYLDSDDIINPHGLAVMVETMEKFPGVALGLSREIKTDKTIPCSFASREAYAEHFLGKGLLTIGPSGTIILREAFEEEKGFSGERYVGDTELWMRLAANHPIVIIQTGLIWWRQHEGQEYKSGSDTGYYMEQDALIAQKMIHSKSCPLEPELKIMAVRKIKQHYARRILAVFFNRGGRRAWQLYKGSGLTFFELLSGFRPYLK